MDSSPIQTPPNHVSSINISARRHCGIRLSHKRQVDSQQSLWWLFKLSKFHHPTLLGTCHGYNADIPVKLTMCRTIKEDLDEEDGIVARTSTSNAVGANRSTKLMICFSQDRKAFAKRPSSPWEQFMPIFLKYQRHGPRPYNFHRIL
ncbi:hypothetical protein RRG08_002732 [Elysia crispata]|uniref:Uncharacterized protein n=1 Tax=Elysia crispata TaxID=231223 RepID=A0AAE0XV84_9GAST|nr:hypothetical protein RRG08_002732 [Elysia crispata]